MSGDPFRPTKETIVQRGEFIDPADLWLPNPPKEWGDIPPDILVRLAPRAMRVERGPNGVATPYYSANILSPEQKKEIEKLARGRWFLLRNNGPHGERLRCGRCKRVHTFYTLACIDRPFHGLEEIVGLITQTDERGQTFDSVRIGTIEPITRERAMLLADRIRGRGEQLYGPPRVAVTPPLAAKYRRG